jgi:guanine deaminase
MAHPEETVMREAIALGRTEETVGVLVVDDGTVVARGTDAVGDRPDATAHSEVEAIREACRVRDTSRLAGCWLYTSHEPCAMCAAACCWARLDGVVFAATDEDMPAEWDPIFGAVRAREVFDRSDHRPELVEEFLRGEAAGIGHGD